MRSHSNALGELVARQLELWADQLLHGTVHLQDLPTELAAFYHLGQIEGHQQGAVRISELEHEFDRLYLAAAHPADRAAMLQQRLDDHFIAEAEHFFTYTTPEAFAA